MLAADKLQLQSALKQQATALKEKEFNLHHSNLMTVGTQAAVLAGLDITMFIEFNPPGDHTWETGEQWKSWMPRILKFAYYIMIVSAFCANMMVVSHTTILSVLGAGLALRGPDGSMMTATDGLYEERQVIFKAFGFGLACTVGSVVICVWLLLHWESALVCFGIAVYTCRVIWNNYKRVYRRFEFDERDTVDFRDIMEGPAAIQSIPSNLARTGGIGGYYSSYTQQNAAIAAAANAAKHEKSNFKKKSKSRKGSNTNSTPQKQNNHRHRRPSPPSGAASYSSLSYSHQSNRNQNQQPEKPPSSFGSGFRGLQNRLRSSSSLGDEQDDDSSDENDISEGGEGDDTSLSSTSDDVERGGGGTVEEIELQPLILNGGDGGGGVVKRRNNSRSTNTQQGLTTTVSSSKNLQQRQRQDDQKKKGDYHIQTV